MNYVNMYRVLIKVMTKKVVFHSEVKGYEVMA
jgi:hypothetical protein